MHEIGEYNYGGAEPSASGDSDDTNSERPIEGGNPIFEEVPTTEDGKKSGHDGHVDILQRPSVDESGGLKVQTSCCYGLCGCLPNWIVGQFTLTTELHRFFLKYNSPHDSFIYDTLAKYKPDCFVLTHPNSDFLLEIAGTICACQKMIAKVTHRHLRVVIMLTEHSTVSPDFFEDLLDITRDVTISEVVTISIIDESASTVNLWELAVNGGPQANWLEVGAHVKRRRAHDPATLLKLFRENAIQTLTL